MATDFKWPERSLGAGATGPRLPWTKVPSVLKASLLPSPGVTGLWQPPELLGDFERHN